MSSGSSDLRSAAAEIVAELANRLRDPVSVAETTYRANADRIDVDNVPVPPWEPASFSRGPAALALFYSELAHVDESYREVAHRYLVQASENAGATKANGPMEGGLGGLAVTTRVAAEGWGDYQAVLQRIDERLSGFARWLIAVHYATRDNGVPTCSGVVDVMSGLAGIGRYLLHRAGTTADALRDVLTCLITLCDPLVVDGVRVPGWWYDGTTKTIVNERFERGQINFGLAHGLPGPLALLSLAWSAGIRVPRQEHAIAQMAEWLLEWRERDEYGHYWTNYIPLDYLAGRDTLPTPRPARPSWCYGAGGIARALELAGEALGRPEWRAAGLDAVRVMLARPMDKWSITDDALCHGWASSLYLLCLFDRHHPGQGFDAAAEAVARRLVAHYDPDAVFGFRFYQPSADLYLDLPGFLEGAAGIGLALHAYATGQAPASRWDTVLMLG